ncbi:hypothetical protein UNPF46_30510 [Bradyrhizobium sp. UNPF46]|uniref:hypothetical protein n=1 Tax=Bradyrhizobium sp. UNPF46 TaxID=1141168 RepID=UPI001151E026|nr:hypothetical protein [Bradyrhizobium sp. UNPF46]TQF27645.1 hypothetical protein UNPF46_30510 [Bradyrhizobium sp. UNPF46]
MRSVTRASFLRRDGRKLQPSERAVAIDDGLHTLDVLSDIFCLVNLEGIALSEQVTTEAPQLAPAKPAVTASQVIAFIKEYFVLVSAAALLLGVTLSTTFLAAYLSVFDWHLLWFVQYTDIITFGLLAVGVITGSLTFIQASAQTVLGLFGMKGKSQRAHAVFLFFFIAAIIAFQVWGARLNGDGYFHVLMGAMVLGLGIVIIMQVMGYVMAATFPNTTQAFWLILSLGFATVSLGQWLGYSVQESAKGQEITLKDKTLSDVKVVLVMSRHTILLKDGMLYVVPTADITSFKGGDQFTPSKPAAK